MALVLSAGLQVDWLSCHLPVNYPNLPVSMVVKPQG